MNRYPLWKYILIVVVLLFGALYTLPNLFGESPALQITSGKATVKVTPAVIGLVTQALQKGGMPSESVFYETVGTQGAVRARFADISTQFKAKSLLEKALNVDDPSDPVYLVAFNLLPNTPRWLQAIHAFPMNKGLDLRGGVHFLMQVDTRALLNKRMQAVQGSARTMARICDSESGSLGAFHSHSPKRIKGISSAICAGYIK